MPGKPRPTCPKSPFGGIWSITVNSIANTVDLSGDELLDRDQPDPACDWFAVGDDLRSAMNESAKEHGVKEPEAEGKELVEA